MKYIIKKFTGLIITLLIVSMLAFLAFEIIPGDPARSLLGTEGTEEQVMALREEMGLNRPLPQRYGSWVSGFVTGDMGTSYMYKTPVSELIGDKIPITVVMTLYALIFLMILSVPLSVVSVRYQDRLFDRCFVILNQIIMAVPPFFIGIIFTIVFGLVLRLFVPGGYVSYTEDMRGFLQYLIFPALAIALPKAAMLSKVLRNALISEMNQDYIRTTYSRGSTPWRALLRHAFRNGMISVITFLGVIIAELIANSIVVEQVFGIPGIGRTLISSISRRDYPVVEAIIVWVAVVVLVINTVVDIMYHKLDKRIEI